MVRPFGGAVYVVNRFGSDTVQRLNPAAGFVSEWECSAGSGTNPNDIAFASLRKAYVPRFASTSLLVVNPSPAANCAGFVLGTIDLSAYADGDGIPDMSQATVSGGRLYVTLQRLTNFMSSGPGAVVVIDTTTDRVLDVIELTAGNPLSQTKGLTVVGSDLVLSEVGMFGVNDGGLERVDLATGTPAGFFITEAAIGGDVTDFVLVAEHLGYALVSGPDFSTALVAFDPLAGVRTRTLLSGGNFSDIEVNGRGERYVADRSLSRPGLRIFRATDGVELTASPIALGLPPFDIAFLE
jgi:DNA-binding beta-propeller fold protein YncE